MSQELKTIKDSKWYSNDPYYFRNLRLDIEKIDTPKEINNYFIKTDLEIITDSEINHNSLDQFFKVSYSLAWHHDKLFDIDRKTKKYASYYQNRLFSFAIAKVYFEKENKIKIKSKIKRILEREIKADMIFYEKYQTIEKPGEYEYLEKSNKLQKILESLSCI